MGMYDLNLSLLDTNFGEKLGAAFDPNVIAQKQNALTEAAMGRQLQGMKLAQGMQEMQQAPIRQAREEAAYQASLADKARRAEMLKNAPIEMQQHFAMGGTPDTWAKLQEKKYELEQARNAAIDTQAWREQQAKETQAQRAADQQALIRLQAGLRPAPPEKMVAVMGNDGNPVMIPQSQSAGHQPWQKGGAGVSPVQRAQDAKDAITILNQAAPLIDKSTSSGLGSAADVAAGFFGRSTGGADAAAQLKVLGGALVSKMPKMSGPQSDKDVLLYKEMAGKIGDPTIPASQKKAAMNTLNELQAKYAGVQEQPLSFSVKSEGGITKTQTGATASGW